MAGDLDDLLLAANERRLDARSLAYLCDEALAGNISFRWHPLGFMHARVLERGASILRFHIWPRSMRKPQDPPWFIHDHNFNFVSYVIAGRLENHIYDVSSDADGTNRLFTVQYYGQQSRLTATQHRVRVAPLIMTEYKQGSYYEEVATDYHSTAVSTDEIGGTLVVATLLERLVPHVVGDLGVADSYAFERVPCSEEEVALAIEQLRESL